MSHAGASKKTHKPKTTDNLKELLKNLGFALQSDEAVAQEVAAERIPAKAKLIPFRKNVYQQQLILGYAQCFNPADLDWDPHSEEALKLPLADLIEQATNEDVKNWAYHVAFKLGSYGMISENHSDLDKTVNGQTVRAWLQSVKIQPNSQTKHHSSRNLRIQCDLDLTNPEYKEGFDSKKRFELERALFHQFPVRSPREHLRTPAAANTPRPHFANHSATQLKSPRKGFK